MTSDHLVHVHCEEREIHLDAPVPASSLIELLYEYWSGYRAPTGKQYKDYPFPMAIDGSEYVLKDGWKVTGATLIDPRRPNEGSDVPNLGHFHETMDRASIITENFRMFILDCPAVQGTPELQEKANRVMDQLMDFYQSAAQEYWAREGQEPK